MFRPKLHARRQETHGHLADWSGVDPSTTTMQERLRTMHSERHNERETVRDTKRDRERDTVSDTERDTVRERSRQL